ncbi:MAG: hypothetical protein HC888_16175 [Candidatus Competibacteraceae bacterium]|nr:hypothetical protein [Candidatus Competibacteraceae bacterium]
MFIALVLLFFGTACHTEELAASLSAEGTVRVNTNTGERTVSSPYIWWGYDFTQRTESTGILEFLLPALPDNSTVHSAELRLRDVRRTFSTPDTNNYTNELIWEAHGYAGDGILSAIDFINNSSISESFTAKYNRDTNGIVSQLSDQGHFTYGHLYKPTSTSLHLFEEIDQKA